MQALPLHPDGALFIRGEELTSVGYRRWRGLSGMSTGGNRLRGPWRASMTRGGSPSPRILPEKRRTGFDDRAIDLVDGVEVAHPLIYFVEDGRRDLARFYARAKARRPAIAAIGSTDFHNFAPVGFCRTFVFARERSVPAILDAVRRGATVACDASGTTYGPDHLSAVVADACRAAAGAPAIAGTWTDSAGMWLVWFGLLALVLVGSRETIA